MKHVTLLFVILPLLYSCSGKSGGADTQAQNQNPNPPPPPPSRKFMLGVPTVAAYEAVVSADGSTVYVYPADLLQVQLSLGTPGGGLRAIIKDGSIRSGCEAQLERRRLYLDDLAHQGEEGHFHMRPDILRDLLEQQRTVLQFEAGYFVARYNDLVPEHILSTAVDAAHHWGFPNVTAARAVTLKALNVAFADDSLAGAFELAEVYSQTVASLLAARGTQHRMLNGEVCELINGAKIGLVFGGDGLDDHPVEMQISGI